MKFRTVSCLCLAATLSGFQPAAAQEKPLSKAQIFELLRSEVVPLHVRNVRLTTLVEERGIDFTPTKDDLEEIKAAGAEDALLKGVREAGKRRVPEHLTPAVEPGRALLGKVMKALGGEVKVRSVKAAHAKSHVQLKTPQGELSLEFESVVVFPDRVWQKLIGPTGEISLVFTPKAAFMVGPMGTRDLPAEQKEEALNDLKRDPFSVAQHTNDPKYKFTAGGTATVGLAQAQVLDVSGGGVEVRWYIDPKSGRVLRASWQSKQPGAAGEFVTDFADWRTADGLTLPFKEVRTRNGVRESAAEASEVEINPAVDPSLFEKPGVQ